MIASVRRGTATAIAAAVLAAMVVAAFVWSSRADGEVHGGVYLAGCGGAAPAPPAQPPICLAQPVDGATVVAVSGNTAEWTSNRGVFSVRAPGRVVGSVRTDAKGQYRFSLPPGDYTIGAKVESWQRDEGNGLKGVPISAAQPFQPVRVQRFVSSRVDIVIQFEAA